MARVEESEDEVRRSRRSSKSRKRRRKRRRKRCKLKLTAQLENDFYLDGDELILPVYPRHSRWVTVY